MAKYWFKADNTVFITHPHGANLQATGENDAASKGGKGQWAQWEVKLLGDDKIRCKNVKTGKYLRIKPNGDIDVGGGEGPWTIFKVHFIEKPHIVKLESDKIDGKFISVKPNGNVNCGNGGPHCRMEFWRVNGGGGGGGNQGGDDAAAADNDGGDGGDEAAAAPAEEEKAPEKELNDDQKAVADWLTKIGHSDYINAFIDNGYEKMETVAMVTEEDLEKMEVKAGHRKEIMLAAKAAPFIGHWVCFRSQHKKRYLEADKGKKEKVELDDDMDKDDAYWFVEQSENGNNLVRFKSKFDTYFRIPNDSDEHCRTVAPNDADARCDVQILPCAEAKKMNVVRVWNPKSANFMTYEDNVMKDRVKSQEEITEKKHMALQEWEIIVKD